MPDSTDKTPSLPIWAQAADVVGFGALLALGAVIIMVVFPGLQTVSPAILVGKNFILSIVAGTACACAGVLLWTRLSCAYRSIRLPASMLGGLAITWLLSSVTSEVAVHSLQSGMPRLLALLTALSTPLFVRSQARLRLLLAAVAIAGVFVALTCVLSFAGWRGFNRLAYGIDPRDVLENAVLAEAVGRGAISEGLGRSPMRSSMGNSEYVGGFLATVAVLLMVPGLYALMRGDRRCGVLALCGGGLCAAALVLAQTRSAFIALGVGCGAAILVFLQARGVIVAATIAGGAIIGAALGPVAGVVSGIAGGVVILVDVLRNGFAQDGLTSLPRKMRWLMAAAPVAAVALLAAYSVPGPWNPGGARILPKLAQALRVSDDSSRERIIFYMIAGELATRSPLLGVGPGFYGPEFHSAFADLAARDESGVVLHLQNQMRGGVAEFAHNDYFQMTAELGLAGLAFFLGGVGALFSGLAEVIRQRTASAGEALAIVGALGAFLAVSMFSGPLHFSDRAAVFWTLCGAGLACIVLASPRDVES